MIFSEEELLTKSSDEIRDIFGKAFSQQFSTTIYRFNPQVVARGRHNWDGKSNKEVELFLNVNELWAPPPGPYLSQGRCNAKGQSLFYCTNNAAIIFWELRCKVGSKLTIGVYQSKEDFKPLGIIGAKKIADIDEDHKRIFGGHYANITENGQKLHDMVEKFFTSKGSQYYNITNAITSIFLHDNTSVPLPPGLTPPDNMTGVIYSTVAAGLNDYNIAFQPEYAEKVLKPNKFFKYEVLEQPDPNKIVVKRTHESREIKPDGTIEWDQYRIPVIERMTDIPM